MCKVILRTHIGEFKIFRDGKSRDVYDLGNELLIVATDRISAFDVIMPVGIPHKGMVLSGVTLFWFDTMSHVIRNHVKTANIVEYPPVLQKYSDVLIGRSFLVKKAKPVMLECVVRGYLAGNGWKEYKETGAICGHKLPKGLQISDKLPESIFTPAIKSDSIDGHDEYISIPKAVDLFGEDLINTLQDYSLKLFDEASRIAIQKGIIIADTKFEFGFLDDTIILIDEIFTPDSSRLWPVSNYQKGKSVDSLDKEFVRSYIITNNLLDKINSLYLPEDIIAGTTNRYVEIYEVLTGKKFVCLGLS